MIERFIRGLSLGVLIGAALIGLLGVRRRHSAVEPEPPRS